MYGKHLKRAWRNPAVIGNFMTRILMVSDRHQANLQWTRIYADQGAPQGITSSKMLYHAAIYFEVHMSRSKRQWQMRNFLKDPRENLP